MLYLDIETDGLNPSKIHFAAYMYEDKPDTTHIAKTHIGLRNALKDNKDGIVVMHNGLAFDSIWLEKLWSIDIPRNKTIDTFVVSKLANYEKFRTHSLGELGTYLGEPKLPSPKDWSVCTPEMITYGKQDVKTLRKVYKHYEKFIQDPVNKDALRLEHDFQYHISRKPGMSFAYMEARDLLTSVKNDIKKLDKEFVPLAKINTETVPVKYNKDGSMSKNSSKKLMNPLAKLSTDGKEITTQRVEPFNPGSHKQRVNLLWDEGWKPKDKTLTHKKAYKEVTEYIKKYGWKVNETNLNTLPNSASDAAKSLAKWITLDSRRQSLEEYIGVYDYSEERINGSIQGIGASTHRCSHQKPNMANIVSPFTDTPTTPVEEIKHKYDQSIKSCFRATPGNVQLGVDASGIQLRLFAHYTEDKDFIKEVESGDIHTKNQKIIGPLCKTRNQAKTFIYAWILGAGIPRIAEVFSCSNKDAEQIKNKFEKGWEKAIKKIKSLVEQAVLRGYFHAIDGRKIYVKNAHDVLHKMLQSAEAIIMKRVYLDCGTNTRKTIVAFVHDEFQLDLPSSTPPKAVGEHLKQVIKNAGRHYKLNCKLEGDYKIGTNWSNTH